MIYTGAELIAICREAALFTIEEEDEQKQQHQTEGGGMPKISMVHLLRSLKGMRRQITTEMLDFYATFRTKTT